MVARHDGDRGLPEIATWVAGSRRSMVRARGPWTAWSTPSRAPTTVGCQPISSQAASAAITTSAPARSTWSPLERSTAENTANTAATDETTNSAPNA